MPAEPSKPLSIEDLLETGRMREQLEIARRIQRGFLPKAPPGLHGFQIDGWNEPCYEAGGDYYDFVRLAGGRLGIAVGDVSGHGIGPALLMASARLTLRALFQVAAGPADALARLNDVLVPDMLEEHFMTMFVGVVDLRTKRFRYAIAGHERPLLLRAADEHPLQLDAAGMPLGVRPGAEYREGEQLFLRDGDLVIGLTDGVSEATNAAGEPFSHERLEATLVEGRHRTASEIVEVVRQRVLSFVGDTRQSDDLTLLVLKVG